jgi:hypothetical protein
MKRFRGTGAGRHSILCTGSKDQTAGLSDGLFSVEVTSPNPDEIKSALLAQEKQ